MVTAGRSNQVSNQVTYPERTVARAARAARCAPFALGFYAAMVHRSVSLMELVGAAATDQGLTPSPISELTAETETMWLIQVGLLRREVDGQGLTDRFRLTPLGWSLLDQWQADPEAWEQQHPLEQWRNRLKRWLHWLG